MAVTLTTIRTQTRGKSPQAFTYQGIGKLTPREVENTKGEKTGVVVDDVDVSGVLTSMQDAIALLLPLADNDAEKAQQLALDGIAAEYNRRQRKAAAPVQEVVTEDELTPLIKEHNLSSEDESVFRRSVTTAHNLLGGDKLALATQAIANFIKARAEKAAKAEEKAEPVTA